MLYFILWVLLLGCIRSWCPRPHYASRASLTSTSCLLRAPRRTRCRQAACWTASRCRPRSACVGTRTIRSPRASPTPTSRRARASSMTCSCANTRPATTRRSARLAAFPVETYPYSYIQTYEYIRTVQMSILLLYSYLVFYI